MSKQFEQELNYWVFQAWWNLYYEAPDARYKKLYQNKMDNASFQLIDWNELSKKLRNL